jgi:ABC-type polysaccharide/polyol phosphate export permease
MAGLVTQYRRVIYAGAPPDLALLAVTALEALAVLLSGLLIFNRLKPAFADEL